MDFKQADEKFKQLKALFKRGELTGAEFKAQLQDLMVQDEQGDWWMIGYETERWYRHDGTSWVQSDPPGGVPQEAGSPTGEARLDRLALERAEAESLAREKRLAEEKAEAERKAREEAERLAAQKAEKERLAQARMEPERPAEGRPKEAELVVEDVTGAVPAATGGRPNWLLVGGIIGGIILLAVFVLSVLDGGVRPKPAAVATKMPLPTPLPGLEVIPVSELRTGIPWLPIDETKRPAIYYVSFNTLHPPFNNRLVRQAFARAIDRDILVRMAAESGINDPVHATTLTPPDTLGRDLYGALGANFDPQLAKDLFAQAGYPDPASFPVVRLVIRGGDEARSNMARAMAEMWQTRLGVKVEIEIMDVPLADYVRRLQTDPPDLYWAGWTADYNDPDNFLRELFHSGLPNNFGQFSSSTFDRLVDRSASISNPAERQQLYIEAERVLCETEVALIPLFHSR